MDSGFYAACAALMARSQALDLVANNLANTSTPGYRGQQNIFRSFLATASGHPGSKTEPGSQRFWNLGRQPDGPDPGQSGTHRQRPGFRSPGTGFFEVKTANGPAYTRNGNFQVSAQDS